MSTWLYVQCVIMLILGQALQVFLIKIPDIKERARAANQKFLWSDWWASDWNVVVATSILGAILIFGLDEVFHFKPIVIDYVKFFFAAVGAVGSNVLLAKWSSYAKYFTTVLSDKANIADAIASGQATTPSKN